MTWHNRLSHKAYFIVFSWIALADLAALFIPGTPSATYYATVRLLHTQGGWAYYFAIVRAIVVAGCTVPLFCRAYDRPLPRPGVFITLFWLRIAGEAWGRNFEWLFIRSAFQDAAWLGCTALAVYAAFTLPSWLAHYQLAFTRKR